MSLDQFAASADDVSGFYASRPGRKSGRPKLKVNRDLPRNEPGDGFVKGPIPLEWLRLASRCGYRAEAVALLVWYAAGVQRANPCKITSKVLAELYVNPRTARKVLERFAGAGLVDVEFHRGRSPVVTITSPGGPSFPKEIEK